jgi:pyruvate-formate lyase
VVVEVVGHLIQEVVQEVIVHQDMDQAHYKELIQLSLEVAEQEMLLQDIQDIAEELQVFYQ